MNKRGQEETGKVLWELVGLILVVVVVAGFLIFIVRFVLAGNSQEEQATTYSFLSLAHRIEKLLADNRPFLPAKDSPAFDLPIYMDDSYVMVGFNKGNENPVDFCDIGSDWEQVVKPMDKCGDDACLCLYPDPAGSDDFSRDSDSPEQPIACRSFPGVTSILSFWYTKTDTTPFYDFAFPQPELAAKALRGQCYSWAQDEAYKELLPLDYLNPNDKYNRLNYCWGGNPKSALASFLLYGQCDTIGGELRNTALYVEKAVVHGKTFILITITGNEEQNARFQKIVDARRLRVEELFFTNTYSLAEIAFKEGTTNKAKYIEAAQLYQQFLDASKGEESIETQYKTLVPKAAFRVSESYLLADKLTEAADAALAFMKQYGIKGYFEQTNEVLLTALPLPWVVEFGHEFNRAYGLSANDKASIDRAVERFKKLQQGRPDDPVIMYLLGTLSIQQGLIEKRISSSGLKLLVQAADALTPQSLVHPAVADYGIARAYGAGLASLLAQGKTPSSEFIDEMLARYSAVVNGYDDSLALLALANDAHTWLALECTRYHRSQTSPCDGLPVITKGTRIDQVYEGYDCSSSVQMFRCGDLTANDFDKYLAADPTAISRLWPSLNNKKIFQCVDNKWKSIEYCRSGYYCGNGHDSTILDANCFPLTSFAPSASVSP
ncbi:hypothetical protein HY493_02190 [Candidatus Woesearchaeota archaeon]|nr:hypothetical protein [Candidatus Woesearchaeota archaeon]